MGGTQSWIFKTISEERSDDHIHCGGGDNEVILFNRFDDKSAEGINEGIHLRDRVVGRYIIMIKFNQECIVEVGRSREDRQHVVKKLYGTLGIPLDVHE